MHCMMPAAAVGGPNSKPPAGNKREKTKAKAGGNKKVQMRGRVMGQLLLSGEGLRRILPGNAAKCFPTYLKSGRDSYFRLFSPVADFRISPMVVPGY